MSLFLVHDERASLCLCAECLRAAANWEPWPSEEREDDLSEVVLWQGSLLVDDE